ncbi:IS481 family transposase [Kineosporia sp. A_224]|uniref:IS481 family transposase n=1 Tax=Kineosporia sp. A_224 TaxID=1962180 RepID=UPI000B4B7292|nr:IS481 family transposase [Kineosporia sp. A_224]
MALVVLSMVEQRLDAVRAVLAGAAVTEVAESVGVSRSTLHRWVGRYLTSQLPGLADRSHRPKSCPHQVSPEVEATVAEMRRAHPRWGSTRIRLELLRKPVAGVVVPSERTIDRILYRQGLLVHRPRKRPRSSYTRFERPEPMQLWGIDIVDGVELVDVRTGEVRVVKVVTGVDDHSRYCVMASVVERATGRAVCLAFATALARFGVPAEVITDNGKQFTDRFGKGGEVLFDKICRHNGISHRLTQPASPNQNGKVERFHGTLGPDFLTDAGPFTSIVEAQAAVDAWVREYNHDRPHQGLDNRVPVVPADRFRPRPDTERDVVPLWVPDALTPTPAVPTLPGDDPSAPVAALPTTAKSLPLGQTDGPGYRVSPVWSGGPVEFDRVVPASGNLFVAGRQFWLGPLRAGKTVKFWADTDMLHLSINGARVKTLRSHLSVNDLARLAAQGAWPAGPPPLPSSDPSTTAVEVERCVGRNGRVLLGGHSIAAAEILAGRSIGIRIEGSTLSFFDVHTRELLRTRPNPLTVQQARALRGARPAGPPPRPDTEPVRVQRRASNSGVVMVVGQKVALGRVHAGKTVTIAISENTLAIELNDGEVHIVRRTTTDAVRNHKPQHPAARPRQRPRRPLT